MSGEYFGKGLTAYADTCSVSFMDTTSLISARLPNVVIARLAEEAALAGVPLRTFIRQLIEARYGLERIDGRRRPRERYEKAGVTAPATTSQESD